MISKPQMSSKQRGFLETHKTALIITASLLIALLFVAVLFLGFVYPKSKLPFAEGSLGASQESSRSFLVGYFLVIAIPLVIATPLLAYLIFVKRAKLQNIFIVAAILFGIPQTLVNTPYAWYDEVVHCENATYFANFISPGNPEPTVIDGHLVWQSRAIDSTKGLTPHKTSTNDYYYVSQHFFEFNTQPGSYKQTSNSLTTYPYQYAPQIIGVTIAHLLDLGQIPTFYLGRLFNFVSFLAAMYLLIKKAPFKTMFCLLGLMPFILGTAASFSYDNFNNIAIFSFVAYILHLAFIKDRVGIRDTVILIITFALFAPLKLIYFPLVFLLLLIPKQKWSKPKSRTFVLLGAAMAGIVMILAGSSLFTNILGSMSEISEFSEQRQAETYSYGIIVNSPITFIKLVSMTAMTNITGFLDGPRYLSILRADLPLWTSILIAVLLLMSVDPKISKDNYTITKSQKVVLACVSAVVYLLSIIALIPHTLIGANTIQGIQGRYHHPIFPLLTLLGQRVIRTWGNPNSILVFCMCCLNVFTVMYLFVYALS